MSSEIYECMKLIIQRNPEKKCLDWRLHIHYREDIPTNSTNKATLRRIHKNFLPILEREKQLALIQSEHLAVHEPMPIYQLSKYGVDFHGPDSWGLQEVAQFSTSQTSNDYGLLRIYPTANSDSRMFLYLLLKVILTHFGDSNPALSKTFLTQEAWGFLFNDLIIRKYFFGDTTLPEEVGKNHGIV